MNQKKIEEENILENFKRVSGLNFDILNIEKTKKVFSDYTGENPDFIIYLENDYVGIELFRLCLTKSPIPIKYGGKEYINQMQRKSEHPNQINSKGEFEAYIQKRKNNPEQYPLIRQDDIIDIIKERLSQKIQKVKNYVTSKNWLLGYADENFNIGMVKDIYSDEVEKIIESFVKQQVNQSLRIERVILFEPNSPKEKIFDIKIE